MVTLSKRSRIIQAAISVFARKGLEKGKIADIAEEAGIGKGTVYEYFRSKEEIFAAIEQSVMGEMSLSLRELVGSELSPTEKIQALMDEGLEMVTQMGDALLIVTELWAQAARGLWHGQGESSLPVMYEDYGQQIEEILAEGMATGEFRQMSKAGVATLLMAFMDGLAWQYMLLRDEQRFDRVKREAIQSFMRGIRK